jgi:hypothetical protein
MFSSNTHLMLASEPTPPEVTAWQHPNYPDTFSVDIDTDDRRGHIALTGTPSQLIELFGRMTQAVTEIATAAGQLPATKAPTQPTEQATTGSS